MFRHRQPVAGQAFEVIVQVVGQPGKVGAYDFRVAREQETPVSLIGAIGQRDQVLAESRAGH